MDKSLLTKIVWLGSIAAIPVAVLALQKPQVTLPAETRRVMTVDKPVAVEFSATEVQGPKPLETAKPLEPAPKPKTMWVGGGKITSKVAGAPQGETAPAAAKDDHSALPAKDPSKLTASVASSAGPRAQ
jgi:hypothetical protein